MDQNNYEHDSDTENINESHQQQQSLEIIEVHNGRRVAIINVDSESDDEKSKKRNIKKLKRDKKCEPSNLGPQEIDCGTNCIICCMDYTNSGEHRLTSLKCGHLFGKMCIERWLKCPRDSNTRRCPTCNKKAGLRDLRVLYARTVIAKDTTELNRLKDRIEKTQLEKNKIELELVNNSIRLQMQEEQIRQLESQLGDKTSARNLRAVEVSSIELSNAGGCRVLAYKRSYSLLVASQGSYNQSVPTFGIKKIDPIRTEPSTYHLYKKPIRDMVFHPVYPLLLSVSVEGSAKLFDFQNNCTTATFTVPDPLWCCCWNEYNHYKFYCGSQNGKIYKFDLREPTKGPEITFSNLPDRTGIISIRCMRRMLDQPRARLVFCRLNDVYTIDGDLSEASAIPIRGNFTSMSLNHETHHLLLTTRPGVSSPSSRHILCRLSSAGSGYVCDVVHTLYGSRTSSTALSRTAFVTDKTNTKRMIAAHNVTNNSIDVWDMQSYDKIPMNITISDQVLDICSLYEPSVDLCFSCLSDKKLYTIKANL